MARKTPHQIELKEACVTAAREVIAELGIEQLSLREVARKLGVSHQAPYRHYPSRGHLLAEVMRRCFESFAKNLDERSANEDPRLDLAELGNRYLAYAATHPLEYRLMFGTPWPEPADHPDLVRDALHAFDVLRAALRRIHGDGPAQQAQVDLQALFIWSSLHGYASITQANVMDVLRITPTVEAESRSYMMKMVGVALDSTIVPVSGAREDGD